MVIPVQEPKIKWLILSTQELFNSKCYFMDMVISLKEWVGLLLPPFSWFFHHTEILTPCHVGVFSLADISLDSLALTRNQLLSC